MKTLKYFSLLLFLVPLFVSCGSENEAVSLKDAFEQVENQYQVTVTYPDSLVNGLQAFAGDWQNQSSLEQSLVALLVPHHLMFEETENGSYRITSFDTGRRTAVEGRAQLNYLSHFYQDKQSWEERKKELRECMYQTLELSPLPPKPDSEPIITNKRTMNGYTVENVAIETLPGLFVTGSLYSPTTLEGKVPVVLSPNGHFEDGRYRPDQQFRMATLARMGAMVFSYDLFGWGESELQVGTEAHRTPIAMTVQVLNGIRILDFLTGLEHADPDRIGITGGSGGGSQTMLLTALDERINVSVPVVMLSSYFNGGCPCESGRPVHLCAGGTNNVEVAAMAAPRPQLVISDGGDWTADVPEIAFPYLQKIYDYYGERSMVENVHLPTEGHDYGFSKRKAMYPFLARHLGLNLDTVKDAEGNIDESDVIIEEESALYVFGENGVQLPDQAIRDFQSLKNVFQ
ncbi:acetylxylan esterase [Aliifodinibius sp. S!AR15-10]|uniref:alpha/beta hydrolase family protein n=1 Tax=Aliifodinibius sp. S!AR15-10 TaxID=2950437 RepID=UPI0028676928|nr:acetylxylan esterase [Aliifodinibius sp. S!AR15-10]MDR8391930.1 acetylxylan esterase [Aliifodinibius sp. S!AR15-10]